MPRCGSEHAISRWRHSGARLSRGAGAAVEPWLQAVLDVLLPQKRTGRSGNLMTVARDPASSANAQLMSSFGPAMKPSRLIIVCQSTLPTPDLLSRASLLVL